MDVEGVRVHFRSSWRNRVAEAVYEIVNDLNAQGVYQFTVRQLFYQLVSRGVFESTRQNYKNFDALLVKLREEDPWLDSQFIDTSKPRFEYYMQSYWQGQEYFPEIWIEKDALRGFFEPFARRYRINLVVCRGYPSVTRLREAKEQRHVPENVRYIILYFGDFDPSGEDIFRWINEELEPYNIEVIKVALTREQVIQYRLPPMIPKSRDPRYRRHVERYGEIAVELDALHPAVLRDIIRRAILQYMDVGRRVDVEVEEEIRGEAVLAVESVLDEIRHRLIEIAEERIREQVMQSLPRVRDELVRRLEAAERISIEDLYNREEILEEIRRELRRILS